MQFRSLVQEDFPAGGHGNLLQYSCLETPMDRGAWQAAVHRVVQSQTQLQRLSVHTQIICIKNGEKGISLVAQWQRIHLAMQGHRFDSWSVKIPHALEQLSPCAATIEPVLQSPGAATPEARVP